MLANAGQTPGEHPEPFGWVLSSPIASAWPRATIQLNVHRQLVQSLPLDDADIECLIQGLRLVTPCTQRIDRLIDLLADPRRWSAGYGSTWVNIIPASHGE